MSHPSYDDFYAALADPSRRPLIGLVISDDDAWSLLENDEWARGYYEDWLALASFAHESAAQEPSVRAPSARMVDAAEPTPAAAAPAAARRPGLPRWALAAIIGGAVVVLLGAVGVGALVYTGITAAGEDIAAETPATSTPAPTSSEASGEASGEAPEGELMPWEEGYIAPYSEAEAAKYLAIVVPLFESESDGSEASATLDLSQSYLLFGSSACVSLSAGFAEAEIVDPIVQASGGKLTADEGQTMIEAAKTYLCQ